MAILPIDVSLFQSYGTILVCLFDDGLRHFSSLALQRAGYTIVSTRDLSVLPWENHIDLLLCEHRPPHLDAIKTTHWVRSHHDTPIVTFVSANEGAQPSELLNAGVDMCIMGGFDANYLLACVAALMRRRNSRAPFTGKIEVGEFRIFPESRRCVLRGVECRLTTLEMKLLLIFAHRPHQVLTYQDLLQALWGERYRNKPELIRPLVMNLRKRVEPDWQRPAFILTEHKLGYRFLPTESLVRLSDANASGSTFPAAE